MIFFIIPFAAVTGLNFPDNKVGGFLHLGLQNFSANFLPENWQKFCEKLAEKF